MDNTTTDNLFMTKTDYAQALIQFVQPIRKGLLTAQKPGLALGHSGAVYDAKRAEMEAFFRPLWGIAPYWTMSKDDALRDAYIKQLIAGTDPMGDTYWGDITDYDQYIVESAAISLMLLLHPDYVWQHIPRDKQAQISRWLMQALDCKTPHNNWLFFKVLIHVAMDRLGIMSDPVKLTEELQMIDAMYVDDGWYIDGKTTQRDYYVAFAFHYYGLLYAAFMGEEDLWGKKFKERATLFAQDFVYYFDGTGEALPYGRSLTYRFAQGAFFSALVFADVEAIPWGEMRQLMSAHMQQWLTHDIFTYDKRLSIGYHYENLVFAEGYNAPGSPYWALKTFLILAVEPDHPFWRAPLHIGEKDSLKLIEKGRMLLATSADYTHVLGFPAGMMIDNQAHAQAKYSKFVYSTKFGFSVPKAGVTYTEGAYDNTLAVSRDGRSYRTKGDVDTYTLSKEKVGYQWSPFAEVRITTDIYPFGQWHVRCHDIETTLAIEIREGGFSVPLIGRTPFVEMGDGWCRVTEGPYCSHIVRITGYDTAAVISPEANTSLFFPRTSFPYLSATLSPGKHRLICLVGGLYTAERKETVCLLSN